MKKYNLPIITVGLSSHRIESLRFAKRLMEDHDVIILEEAPNPKFMDMLNKKISIKGYIEEEDMGFSEFSNRMYRLLRRFSKNGKKILQIEPYIERLMEIYRMFSAGKEPSDILKVARMKKVYEIERKVTGTLLHYYESTTKDSFSKVIEAVKKFARIDAERFRLRDKMRAEVIAAKLPEDKRVYIEAGEMHVYFLKILGQIVGRRYTVKSEYLLEPVVNKLTGKRRVVVPGNILTAHYILYEENNEEYETLQAARSIIYILILEKEEMIPSRSERNPHIKNEIEASEIVNKLTLNDCEELYGRIRFKEQNHRLSILKAYLKENLSHSF